MILYLDLTPEQAAQRASFGQERYETIEFQTRVVEQFSLLRRCGNWKASCCCFFGVVLLTLLRVGQIIDACQSPEEVFAQVHSTALQTIEVAKDKPFGVFVL